MTSAKETLYLTRDVDVITIPEGYSGQLTAGSSVTLYQALGNHYTVITDYGQMVRIAGKDADALGKSLSTSPTIINETDIAAIEQNCWTAMKNVYDPEIPVNIVDLGLIYACEVTAMAHGEHQVRIKMTLTAPGCGMGPVLQNDVRNALLDLPHIAEVSVEIVLDPPWAREMMSEVAQIQLGLI